jgi:hypothetical protein
MNPCKARWSAPVLQRGADVIIIEAHLAHLATNGRRFPVLQKSLNLKITTRLDKK